LFEDEDEDEGEEQDEIHVPGAATHRVVRVSGF
jgi:hypothetical protein